MIYKLTRKCLFPAIFISSFLIFLAHTAFTKTAIFADGRYYYAYTRSIVSDFNLKLINEYQTLDIKSEINSRGLAPNIYPPGASFFWVPLFWMTDNFVKSINVLTNISIDESGFGFIYQCSISATSIFLGVLGLYLTYLLLKDYFSERIALLTSFALFSTTNLLFYLAVEPINSHAISFFMTSLFVFYFLKGRERKFYYFILGILGGIAGLVRTQDALILILPITGALILNKISSKNLVTNSLLLFAGFLIGFLPQIILWKLFFNFFFNLNWIDPRLGYGFTFLTPHIGHVLFNSQNGLFTITPAVAIALAGLFLFKKKNKRIFSLALFYFLLQLYLISSWQEYSQGGSFSIRMMITTYPLLSFGLASIIEKSVKKVGDFKTVIAILFFSALNSALIIRYLLLY